MTENSPAETALPPENDFGPRKVPAVIIIGLLLLLLAAAIIIVMVMAGNEPVSLSWDAVNLNWTPSALVVFVLGAATLLLLVLAFAALRGGTRRKMAKSSELRRLRKLDAERETHRGGATATTPVAKTPSTTSTSTSTNKTGLDGTDRL